MAKKTKKSGTGGAQIPAGSPTSVQVEQNDQTKKSASKKTRKAEDRDTIFKPGPEEEAGQAMVKRLNGR